jgi:cytochrome c
MKLQVLCATVCASAFGLVVMLPVLRPRAAVSAAAGDAARGKLVFEKRCTGCHSLDTDKEGPHLRHAFGSKAANSAGFTYSAALRGSGIVWDETTLDKWLTNPGVFVAGADMDFRVRDAGERADVIRYLRETAGQ